MDQVDQGPIGPPEGVVQPPADPGFSLLRAKPEPGLQGAEKEEQAEGQKGASHLHPAHLQDPGPPAWLKRLLTLVANLRRHSLALPSVDQMILDAEAAHEEQQMRRAYNFYLASTRSGNRILARHRMMLCMVNPFSIAALLIACKMLRLRHVDRQHPCPVREDLIAWCLAGHLAHDYYTAPSNSKLMQLAVEKFVLAITGGLAYGRTMALELWPA